MSDDSRFYANPAESLGRCRRATPVPPAETNPDDDIQCRLQALLSGIAQRDRHAFEALYELTLSRVYSLALHITRQPAVAEDVSSDVFFQVWQNAHQYTPARGSVLGWLGLLARSRALDTLRRNRSGVRQGQVTLESVPEPDAETDDPEQLLSALQQGSLVRDAIKQLPAAQRQLIMLAYFRGYTHAELARLTDMPIGTVKTRLHRAIQSLKQTGLRIGTDRGDSDD